MGALVISYPIPSDPKWWSDLQKGVEAYSNIMGYLVHGGRGPLDSGFQKACNDFFQIRRMPEEWRTEFYGLFYDYWSQGQGKRPDFKTVLTDLHKWTCDLATRRTSKKYALQCSFTSKMVHMLNSDLPIWDSKVIGKLSSFCGKYRTEWDDKKKLAEAPFVYKRLTDWYGAYLSTTNAKDVIAEFDSHFPAYASSITQTKKIDFMLWKL